MLRVLVLVTAAIASAYLLALRALGPLASCLLHAAMTAVYAVENWGLLREVDAAREAPARAATAASEAARVAAALRELEHQRQRLVFERDALAARLVRALARRHFSSTDPQLLSSSSKKQKDANNNEGDDDAVARARRALRGSGSFNSATFGI